MFSGRLFIVYFCLLTVCGASVAMQERASVYVVVFNNPADFAQAVKLAQRDWVLEVLGAGVCAGVAIAATVGTAACVSDVFNARLGDDRLSMVAWAAAGGTAAAVCAYGCYALAARSTDYGAARRVAQRTCPHCLKRILLDPRAAAVLSEGALDGIVDALECRDHAVLCPEAQPQMNAILS